MEGTQFEFSYAPGVTQEQIIGFEMAGEIWSQYLTDNVTINIHVDITDELPENVVGGALPGTKKDVEYKKLWEELSEDIKTLDDLTVFNNSAVGEKEFSALINGQEVDELKKLKVTNANSKALGLINGEQDKLDGYIVMSDLSGQSNVQWEYDYLRDGNIAADSLDFVSVAMHEVGHVLGFVSGIDDGGLLNVVTEAQDEGKEIKGDKVKFATPLDLFRYTGAGQMDLSIGAEAYFSIDGGQTNLGNFSTGESSNFGGDGFQGSHWKQSEDNPLGIMDPLLKLGQQREISALDTTAMDVMGWDVVDPGELDWQELYNNVLDDVDDAWIEDRDKDVEKMIKDSETYKGSRSSRGRRGRRNQIALWQNMSFQTLDLSSIEVEPALASGESLIITDYLIDTPANQEIASNDNKNEIETAVTDFEIVETEASELKYQETAIASNKSLDLSQLGSLIGEAAQEYGSLG